MKSPFTPPPAHKKSSPVVSKIKMKPETKNPRDIVSSVVQAHKHHAFVETVRDGFGNVSSRNIL